VNELAQTTTELSGSSKQASWRRSNFCRISTFRWPKFIFVANNQPVQAGHSALVWSQPVVWFTS